MTFMIIFIDLVDYYIYIRIYELTESNTHDGLTKLLKYFKNLNSCIDPKKTRPDSF